MLVVTEQELPLQRIYHWEKTRGREVFLTQPLPGGAVRDYTWKEALAESRRVAAHLRAQGWPAGSRVAILAKNCANWILADLAIWIAGYVSVPVYPSIVAGSLRQILRAQRGEGVFRRQCGRLESHEIRGAVRRRLHRASGILDGGRSELGRARLEAPAARG